jgi:hypothetical protein
MDIIQSDIGLVALSPVNVTSLDPPAVQCFLVEPLVQVGRHIL